MATKGSSPRVRGKQAHVRLRRRPARLIPARAGKTRGWPGGCSPTPAHPRACGENGRRPPGPLRPAGSSPRVRGKHSRGFSDPPGAGLIPARAGKTTIPLIATAPLWAHPRACGENGPEHRRMLTWLGSSPRVRGKLQGPVHGDVGRGLIPARAGKTQGFIPALAGNRAHPRACGENPPWVWTAPRPAGSSPRVRGKPPRVRGKHQRSGLIPARAGKTSFWAAAGVFAGAHPRACGENRAVSMRVDVRGGSSPRVRGKLRGVAGCGGVHGLIPARAGKTRLRILLTRSARAHPRACGENGPYRDSLYAEYGSSPRVRGKRREPP